MGNTKDYLDYLNNEVGIAPAASQEELDLAQSLADTYAKHGLDPEVQEFPAQSLGMLPYGVVMVLLFVGIVLVGIGLTPTTLLGLLFVAGSTALLAMTYTGQDVISKVGPRAHSQNVVAVRRADEGNERNRPIVILAHYDTPRVDPLASSQFVQLKKYLPLIAPNAIIAIAICTLVQLLGFLPEAARRTFWILGIIAAIPELIWGVALIARKFSAYADGAVGNKSSVAAVLSVMDHVCAGDAEHERKQPVVQEKATGDEPAVRPLMRKVVHTEVEPIEGKRHGEAVLRELGILPAECQITYVEPEVHTYETEEPIEYDDELVADSSATNTMPEVAPSEQAAPGESESDLGATRPMAQVPEQRLDAADTVLDAGKLSQLEDGQSTEEGPLQETDHSGLSTMVEEDAEVAAVAPRVERSVPAAMDDPEWGKSSYTPASRGASANVARRAALFDLPDVSETDDDGLSSISAEPAAPSYGMNVSTSAPQTATPSPMAQRLAEASAGVAAAPAPVRLDNDYAAPAYTGSTAQDDIEVMSAPAAADAPAQGKRRGLSKLFGRKRKQQQESMSEWLGVDEDFNAKTSGENIGSWDNFDGDEPRRGHWKGGAARNVNLRGNVLSTLGALPEIGEEDPADIPLSALKNPAAALAQDAATQTATETPAAEPVDPEATIVVPASEIAATAEPMAPVEPSEATSELSVQDNPYLEADEGGLFVEVGADGEPVIPDSEPADSPEAEEATEEAKEPASPEFTKPVIDRELRDAILAMSDDELKKHDVWFVLTGASELNHAGVSEFVAEHRKDLRGAFIINLESVGAGELTMLTNEGFGRPRRADKRLMRLLSGVASDMHMELPQVARAWADTEATPCMRRSLRGVTLMGMGAHEVPAYSATAADMPDAVDEERVVDVVALVTEAIRRS